MLEHVTREITVEALPTEIPESIPADVSEMAIGDTLQLSALIASRGSRVRRPTTPRRSRSPPSRPPRVEEEPEPELEEEAELVGEEGEAPEGEEARGGRGPGRGRGRGPRPRARRCSSGGELAAVASAPAASRRSEGSPRSRRAPSGCWSSGLGNPGLALRRHPPQPRLRGRRRAHPALGAAAGAKERFRGLITEGRAGPGGPRVAVLMPQTYMNESGSSAGPARGALKRAARSDRRRPRRDRPAVRRGAHQARRRARRPQRAEEPRAGPRRAATSGGSGPASGGPTPPIPRSSPPTSSSRFARARGRGARAGEPRRRRDRAAGRRELAGPSDAEPRRVAGCDALTSYDVDEAGVALLRLERARGPQRDQHADARGDARPPGDRARRRRRPRPGPLLHRPHGPLGRRRRPRGARRRGPGAADGALRAALRRADRLSRSPTVAACHGSCVGGGAEIAVACDLRVGGSNLRMRFPGAALGVPVGPARLVTLCGLSVAKYLLLTAQGRRAPTRRFAGGSSTGSPPPPPPRSAALKLAADVADTRPRRSPA